MNKQEIFLVGGVANGKRLTVPDGVDRVSVPTLRLRCEHDPEGIGTESVTVTYRPMKYMNSQVWKPDTNAVAFGWWCQQCQMDTKIARLESEIQNYEAKLAAVREALDGDDE